MSRRLPHLLQLAGTTALVVALSVVHGRVVAEPAYDFFATSRLGWAVAWVALLGVSAYAMGLPDLAYGRRYRLGSAVRATAGAAVGMSVVQLVVGDALLPRFVVFGSAVVCTAWFVACSALVDRRRGSSEHHADRVLVVSDHEVAATLADDLLLAPEQPAVVAGVLAPSAAGAEAGAGLLVAAAERARATVVVLGDAARDDPTVVAQAAALHERGVRIRDLVGFYGDWLGKVPVADLERTALMFDIGELHRARYARVKRVVDLGFGVVGVVALAPLVPLVVLGNVVANRGPLLFRQERVGKGGAHFTILKLRTMRPGADEASRWTSPDDPRITPFGRFLRRTHLDELPQAVNILRGDLSVVGPRPEQPRYVEELVEKLPFYDLRHLVRPGLTGWAQVKYGYAGDEVAALEKLQYDVHYLRRQSLLFDLRIIWRTTRAVLRGDGR